MVISKGPWHSLQLRAFGSGTVTTCFNDSDLSLSGIEPRSLACGANALPLCHRGGSSRTSYNKYIVPVQPTNQIFRVSEHLFDFFQWYDQIKSKQLHYDLPPILLLWIRRKELSCCDDVEWYSKRGGLNTSFKYLMTKSMYFSFDFKKGYASWISDFHFLRYM